MDDCIFCQIVDKKAPASIEHETDLVIAFKSIDPAADTHLLIVPKKHVSHVDDFSKEDKDLFFEMLEVAQSLVHSLDLSDGYKLVFNAGRYQAIPHVHWHLLAGNLEADKT